MSARSVAALLAVTAALGGCGLKGPLYLPEKSQEIVVRPGTAAAPAAPTGATGPATESAPPPAQPPATEAPPPTVPEDSQARPPGSGRG